MSILLFVVRSRTIGLFVACCFGLFATGCERPSQAPLRASRSANATVVEVIDGDTVRLEVATGVEVVRLLGIDTPETVDPNRPAQCFGAEASAYLTTMLPVGTPVLLTRDQQIRDVFGRLLGYVFVASSGQFTNAEMIRGGFANTLSIEPNNAYRDTFADALRDAKKDKAGLWAKCDGPDQPLVDGRAP